MMMAMLYITLVTKLIIGQNNDQIQRDTFGEMYWKMEERFLLNWNSFNIVWRILYFIEFPIQLIV
jgi:hypothetical protein